MNATDVVLKLGGSVLASPRRVEAQLDALASNAVTDGGALTLVVSALFGVTARLHRMLEGKEDESRGWEQLFGLHSDWASTLLRSPAARERFGKRVKLERQRWSERRERSDTTAPSNDVNDLVHGLIVGERLSAALLTEACRERFGDASLLLPEELPIAAVGPALTASADVDATRRAARVAIRRLPDVRVVPGFYGVDSDNRPRLWGFGGTDYSAAVVAAALDAARLDVRKDIGALHTADPRIVPDPHVVRRLSYRTAGIASALGAELLHPRTLDPLERFGIPLVIRDPDGNAGTRIDARETDTRLVVVGRDVAIRDEESLRSGTPDVTSHPLVFAASPREPIQLQTPDGMVWLHTATSPNGRMAAVSLVGRGAATAGLAPLTQALHRSGVHPASVGTAFDGNAATVVIPADRAPQTASLAHDLWVHRDECRAADRSRMGGSRAG